MEIDEEGQITINMEPEISLCAVKGMILSDTMRILAKVQGAPLITLIDSGSTQLWE